MAANVSKMSSLRLLVLTPEEKDSDLEPTTSVISSFLERLTDSKPSEDIKTFAGYTSHAPLNLKTKYYETHVNIWCDELPPPRDGHDTTSEAETSTTGSTFLEQWNEQMTSSEAVEVREVIGAVALVLAYNSSTLSSRPVIKLIEQWLPYIEAASALRDATEAETGRDVASLVVLQDTSRPGLGASERSSAERAKVLLLQQLEDECLGELGVLGWDFIEFAISTAHERDGSRSATQSEEQRNEYGERTGFARVIEVLSGVNWLASTNSAQDDGKDDEFGLDELGDIPLSASKAGLRPDIEGSLGSNHGRAFTNENDFQDEMMGLKLAMLDLDRDAEDGGSNNKLSPLFDESDARKLDMRDMGSQHGENVGKDDDVWASLDDRPQDPPGDEIQVDQLQSLMERVVAIREAGSEMTREQREQFAKREIAKIMRELG